MNLSTKQIKYFQLLVDVIVLILALQIAQTAKAEEIELRFGLNEANEEVVIESPQLEPQNYSDRTSSLQVLAPELLNDIPPGSYRFSLLQEGRESVKIPSPCSGTVTYTKESDRGYGNRIEVLCDRTNYVYFMAHLESISVQVGQQVTQGEALGIQGSEIHLEIGTRPYLEFYPEHRLTNRAITSPLVYAYFETVSRQAVRETNLSQNQVGLDFSPPEPEKPTVTVEALSFEPPTAVATVQSAPKSVSSNLKSPAQILEIEPETKLTVAKVPDDWWEKGSNSPLAIAIGSAEGTRQPDGTKNSAYYWHSDPGNGRDNFGTFSYQHLSSLETYPVNIAGTAAAKQQAAAENQLPEKADKQQLKRLKTYHNQLRSQAIAQKLELNSEELVNGLDLANQSPAAGLLPGGYIDRLAQMKQLISDPEEQIKEARVWSYWDMDKNRWDAPGLGNTYESIRHDQERRYQQVKKALEHQQQIDLASN